VALVLSRLDYCNGVLAGLPANQLNRLQSVLHAAARERDSPTAPADAITRSHCYDGSTTGCLFLSVWSSSCVRCVHRRGADYLSNDECIRPSSRTKTTLGVYCSLNWLSLPHDTPHLATGLSRHCRLQAVKLTARQHHSCKLHLC